MKYYTLRFVPKPTLLVMALPANVSKEDQYDVAVDTYLNWYKNEEHDPNGFFYVKGSATHDLSTCTGIIFDESCLRDGFVVQLLKYNNFPEATVKFVLRCTLGLFGDRRTGSN